MLPVQKQAIRYTLFFSTFLRYLSIFPQIFPIFFPAQLFLNVFSTFPQFFLNFSPELFSTFLKFFSTFSQPFPNLLKFLTLSLISGQHGVTYPSTLDAPRLKIMFRSVDSDSESTSERKNEIALFGKMQSKSGKSGKEIWDILRFFHFPKQISGKKCNFP